jgi:hypothetical protein
MLNEMPDGSSESLASLLWAHRPLDHSLRELDPAERKEFESWCASTHRRVFSLATRRTKILVGITAVAGVATALFYGLPFQNAFVNIGSVTLFVLLLALSGHAASVIIGLVTLTELAQRPVRAPFFRFPHPAFTALLHYYSTVAVLVSGAYVLLAFGISVGPYGFTPPMLAWLTVLALFPLVTSTWSVIQVHELLQRAKQLDLAQANSVVAKALAEAQMGDGASPVEVLSQAMVVQSMVQSLRDWPVPLSAILTFAAALSTTAIQAGVVALASSAKP